MGSFDTPRALIKKNTGRSSNQKVKRTVLEGETVIKELELKYIKTFENLITIYRFHKDQFSFLLDASATPPEYLNYLNNYQFKYMNFL